MKRHETEIRVRYSETDQMGVVYNSHFLVYFEIGRTDLLRSSGFAYRGLEARGVFLPVVEAHCRYLRPVRYDDVIVNETWVSRLRHTRIDFGHSLSLKADGRKVAEGRVVLACLDAHGKPRRLPEEVARAIGEV